MFRKSGYLSRTEEFSGTGMHSQPTTVPKPEGMTQLHLCYTEDRPASNIIHPKCREECGQHMQVPCPQCAGFQMEIERVLQMGALAPTSSCTVWLTSRLRKKCRTVSQDKEYSQTKTDSEIKMSSRKVSKLVPGD